jgi:hypothetical protein
MNHSRAVPFGCKAPNYHVLSDACPVPTGDQWCIKCLTRTRHHYCNKDNHNSTNISGDPSCFYLVLPFDVHCAICEFVVVYPHAMMIWRPSLAAMSVFQVRSLSVTISPRTHLAEKLLVIEYMEVSIMYRSK